MKKGMIMCALACLIVLAGCANTKNGEDNTITLGSILILTGEGANWGTAAKNGIDMAIEDINNDGGINGKMLRAMHEDDKSDPKVALSAYQKLKTNNVDYIIGTTWSHTGLAIKDRAIQDKTIMISPSLGVAEFNEASEYLFNTWPHDFILSEKLAELVYEKGHRNVALFGAQQVWVKDQTNAFKKKFEALGGNVAYTFEPKIEEKDVSTDVLKVKGDESVDAIVYMTTLYNLGIETAQKFKEFNVNLPAYSISIDDDIITSANGAYDDILFLTFLSPTEKFRARYAETYGDNLNIGADSGYDAVMMLAEAIEKTDSEDPDDIQKYLNNIKTYAGESGNLVSDGKGGFEKPFVTMVIRNGRAQIQK